ncbi:hypothetical protein APHAL10511_007715 [Amanita phalloides]|nr:hypothetical protein APHAL10511_007715 [Amanita phalloides]
MPNAYTRHVSSSLALASTSSGRGPNNRSTHSSPSNPPAEFQHGFRAFTIRISYPSNSLSDSFTAFQPVPSGLHPTVSAPVSSPQNAAEGPVTGTLTTQEIPSDSSAVDRITRPESPEQSPVAGSGHATKATELGITGKITRYRSPESAPSPSRLKASPLFIRWQNNNNMVSTGQTDPSSYKCDVWGRGCCGLSDLRRSVDCFSWNANWKQEAPFPTSTDTIESLSSPSQRSYHSTHSSTQPEPAPLTPSPSFSIRSPPPFRTVLTKYLTSCSHKPVPVSQIPHHIM